MTAPARAVFLLLVYFLYMDETDDQLEEGLEHLKNIEEELSELKERTSSPWNAFRGGVLQGVGAIVGSIIALIVLGWLLSLFGLLPGFGWIAHYIQNVASQLHR